MRKRAHIRDTIDSHGATVSLEEALSLADKIITGIQSKYVVTSVRTGSRHLV